MPIPVASPSKAGDDGRSIGGISGSNPAIGMNVCLSRLSVLSGTGLRDGQIPRPEEFYRVCCVCG